MSQQEPSDEQVVEAVYAFAAEQMQSGATAEQIISMLVDRGLDHQSAEHVVSNLASMRSGARREAGRKDMVQGALWCIGGIVVTAVTYNVASGGGTYVVAWGAILFGAIQFLRGLFRAVVG